MNKDINIKKTRLNCFRQSKVPGLFMLQMRAPGGMVDAKYLADIEYISKTWGDGNFHFGTRQTFDICGIKYEDIPAVNEYIEKYIKGVDVETCNVDMNKIANEPVQWDEKSGYPTIGARNITACIGNYHCICGNVNTYELARKIENIIFPSHYHIKINIAGCPNDCNKAHLCDFGIIGTAKIDFPSPVSENKHARSPSPNNPWYKSTGSGSRFPSSKVSLADAIWISPALDSRGFPKSVGISSKGLSIGGTICVFSCVPQTG